MRLSVSEPSIGQDEAELVHEVVASGWLTQGPMVRRFELALAERLEVPYVVACSSGTAALHLALRALGVGPGDEVLVPDLTYVATANAVAYCGARPVMTDVLPTTWCMDLADAERRLGPRTRAILPVHLYGVPSDMSAVTELARARGLAVLEDAAEALGASWASVPCGAYGDAGCFSFYANKLITTGEGGAVATRSGRLAERARLLRGQAQEPERRFWHSDLGYNYRMTDLQAAVGVAQLGRFGELLERRRAVYRAYEDAFYGSALHHGWDRAPWLFSIELRSREIRDGLAQALEAQGVETRPVFEALHRMPMYRRGRADGDFPVASRLADRGLSLPTHANMSPDDAYAVAGMVQDYLAKRGEAVAIGT